MPSIINSTGILYDLVTSRLQDYMTCLDAAVYDEFDFEHILKSYNTVLKKRFAVVAFMTSRLTGDCIFDVVEKCQRRIMTLEWSAVSKNQSQSGLGSLLTITSSQHHYNNKTPIAHCLFVCHLMDILAYSHVQMENCKLTAFCLEHYFTLLQYNHRVH